MLSEKLQTNDRAWALYYRDKKSIADIAEELGWERSDLANIDHNVRAIVELGIHASEIQRRHIKALENHVMMQQLRIDNDAKLLDNMADMLDAMTGRKKAEAEAKKLAKRVRFQFKQGGNRWQSVKLGLAESIWFAPLSLLHVLQEPVQVIFYGLVGLVVRLAVWLYLRPKLIIMGLLGRVQPAAVEN